VSIKPYIKDSSKYCADTRRNGRRIRKLFPRTREGKKDAELWVLAQKSATAVIETGHRSFAEGLSYLADTAAFEDLGNRTKKKYLFRLNTFLEFAAGRNKLYLSEVSNVDAEAYGKFIVKNFIGRGRTERLRLAALLFKAEIDRDDSTMTRNPFRNVKKNFDTVGEVQFIERETLSTIMHYATDRERAVITIIYTTGMRSSEFAHLRKEDVFKNGTRITKYGEHTLKTKGSADVIPHGEATWQAYQWLFANNPEGDFVLLGDRRAHHSYIWKMITALRQRIQKDIPTFKHFTPHSFRRSLSTHLAEENVPVPAIKSVMRHTSEKITMKYYIGKTQHMTDQAIETTGHLVSTFLTPQSQ
jgi:integrase